MMTNNTSSSLIISSFHHFAVLGAHRFYAPRQISWSTLSKDALELPVSRKPYIRTVDFYLLCNSLKKIADGVRSVGPIRNESVLKDKVGPGSRSQSKVWLVHLGYVDDSENEALIVLDGTPHVHVMGVYSDDEYEYVSDVDDGIVPLRTRFCTTNRAHAIGVDLAKLS
jgi:hypothetical protein